MVHVYHPRLVYSCVDIKVCFGLINITKCHNFIYKERVYLSPDEPEKKVSFLMKRNKKQLMSINIVYVIIKNCKPPVFCTKHYQFETKNIFIWIFFFLIKIECVLPYNHS